MKKQKKEHYPEVVLKEKIRDVETNQKQHFLLFVGMLVLFNVVLLAVVGFVLVYLNRWYNWLMCFIIVALCFWLSFKTYIGVKSFHKCELYENAIAINSIWFNMVADFKNISEIIPKKSIIDKLFKLHTNSLEIRLINGRRKKFTIHFIEEDVNKLKDEIHSLMGEE